MTKEAIEKRRNSSKVQANLCNFVLFLTGTLLGCLVAYLGDLQVSLDSIFAPSDFLLWNSLPEVMVANGKFLLLLFLLAFMQSGAMLIPPLFGLEGMLFGCSYAASFSQAGLHGMASLGILWMLRLFLVLPYGFLLGTWAVDQSLNGITDADGRSRLFVLLLTLLVLAVASLGECTLGRWLGGIYYFNVGV